MEYYLFNHENVIIITVSSYERSTSVCLVTFLIYNLKGDPLILHYCFVCSQLPSIPGEHLLCLQLGIFLLRGAKDLLNIDTQIHISLAVSVNDTKKITYMNSAVRDLCCQFSLS
jgi:hypothetical protein